MLTRIILVNLLIVITFVLCHLLTRLNHVRNVHAQTSNISLSVTPPLIEILAKPGKAFEQRYLITNNGSSVSLKVNIAPFIASDSYGNVTLKDNLSDFDPQSFASWFTFVRPKMKYSGRVYVPQGETREVAVRITPPEDASEGDYYFTITFETDYGDEVIAGNTISKAKIGANILLTVSQNENPTKKAKIVSFQAPSLIDGLVPIIYQVEIANIGNTFFKPIGKIIIRDVFGRTQILTLAPQNILASSKRNIPCIEGERLVSCTIKNRVPFGIYRANLIFNAEGGEKLYQEDAVTVVLPTTIILSLILIVAIIINIMRKIRKKPNPH